MMCAHCLLFDIDSDAVATVNGITLCKLHATNVLRGVELRPPTARIVNELAPERVNPERVPVADPAPPPPPGRKR